MPTFEAGKTNFFMKTKRNIASLIAAGALFLASCSSMFYPKANALDAIKQGMTQEEVTKLLGRPDFRRIDYGLEEWEYRKLFSPLACPRGAGAGSGGARTTRLSQRHARQSIPRFLSEGEAGNVQRRPDAVDTRRRRAQTLHLPTMCQDDVALYLRRRQDAGAAHVCHSIGR